MNTVADTDGDGRDEAIFYSYSKSGGYSLQAKRFEVDPTTRQLTNVTSTSGASIPATSSSSTSSTQVLGIFPVWSATGDGVYTPGSRFSLVFKRSVNSSAVVTGYSLSTLAWADGTQKSLVTIAKDASTTTCFNDTDSYAFSPMVGNFDSDPGVEILFANKVYDFGGADGMQIIPSTITSGAASTYCSLSNRKKFGFGGSFEWVVDLNGDGIDEVVDSLGYYEAKEGQFVRVTFAHSPMPSGNINEMEITFGDLNGDGLADEVTVYAEASSTFDSGDTRTIRVALGTGGDFLPPADWISPDPSSCNTTTRILCWADNGESTPRVTVADLNGDGFGDIFVHRGYNRASSSGTRPQESLTGRFYFSTGTAFSAEYFHVDSFLGLGDFDGDGRLDIISGAQGDSNNEVKDRQIYYGNTVTNGGSPGAIWKVVEPTGRATSVGYGPDRAFADNKAPGVSRVVTSVAVDAGGPSPVTTTSFEYSGARFNYDFRRSMGYSQVTSILSPITGETDAPRVISQYYNTMATAGQLASQKLYSGPTTALVLQSNKQVTLTYTTKVDGLPFSATTTSVIDGTRFGTGMVYGRKDYTQNKYGEVTSIIDFGIISPTSPFDDQLIAAGQPVYQDNTVTLMTYSENTTNFLVGLLASRKVLSDTSDPTDPSRLTDVSSRRLSGEFFRYDGLTVGAPSNPGNLTSRLVWDDLAAGTRRVVETNTYFPDGNLKDTSDANSNQTSFTYDPVKNLFVATITNAVGQTASKTWNTACQTPATETDLNGLVASYTYDAFCRQIERDLPTSQYDKYTYVNFGNPDTQYVRHESLSGSTVVGSTLRYEWTYFDGAGRTYKSAHSGVTSSNADAIVTSTTFDARGNIEMQSNPRFDLASSAGAGQKTTFSYDALNRPIARIAPNGAVNQTNYLRRAYNIYGASMSYPAMQTLDAHCFDEATETDPLVTQTICGDLTAVYDQGGRKVRDIRVDRFLTDTAGGTATGRATVYQYDILGRLTDVTDPSGAVWSYGYDALGNRTTASDPGFGSWAMTYDNNGNLLAQTDSAGHVISFTYDSLNRVTKKKVKASASAADWSETSSTYDQARTNYFNIGFETTQRVAYFSSPSDLTGTQIDYRERDYNRFGLAVLDRRSIGGLTYNMQNAFTSAGQVLDQTLPYIPGQATVGWIGQFSFDAGSRVTGLAGYVSQINYNAWDSPTKLTYVATDGALNAGYDAYTIDPTMGWITAINGLDGAGQKIYRADYARSVAGRISQMETSFTWDNIYYDWHGSYSYGYDYAGRLRSAIAISSNDRTRDQFLTYDPAGRIRSKGSTNPATGIPTTEAYTYGGLGANGLAVPFHAPKKVGGLTLAYDANGNMLTGLGGKIMTYDNENRPLSVLNGSTKTCYVYGVDGARLKKIVLTGASSATACPAASATGLGVTVYFNNVEIRNFRAAGSEQIITYPHPNVQKTNSSGSSVVVNYLHFDHLGSVRAVSKSTGTLPAGAANLRVERKFYKPFGEEDDFQYSSASAPETKGFIGERLDGEAGLQYLNARYYDPQLGMFIQPDWWEVTQRGVGTNRYAYAGGDPVNGKDANGNEWLNDLLNWAGGFLSSAVPASNDRNFVVNSVTSVAKSFTPGWHHAEAASSAWDRGDYWSYAGHEVIAMGEVALAMATLGESSVILAETRAVQSTSRNTAKVMPDGESFIDSAGRIRTGSAGGIGAGKRISETTRKAEHEFTGSMCSYCGEKTLKPQADHIKPRNPAGAGPRGNNGHENTATACPGCNFDKSNQSVIEWIAKTFGYYE